MHKLVLDTNVIISSFLGKGYPWKIIHELVMPEKIRLILSSQVADEYSSVIRYRKFKKYEWYHEQSIVTLNILLRLAKHYPAPSKFDLLPDKEDNKFLDLSHVSNADFLITGNSKHFPRQFENTKILSPKEYWDKYWK